MRCIVIKTGLDCSIRIMVSRTIIENIRFSVLDLRQGAQVRKKSVEMRSLESASALFLSNVRCAFSQLSVFFLHFFQT